LISTICSQFEDVNLESTVHNDDDGESDILTASVRQKRSPVTDNQIKVHNSIVEMGEYSSKIIQLTKVNEQETYGSVFS
jgi:hypothetical protein